MKLFDVYSLYSVEPVRGDGFHVYDDHGTQYLDLYGGHAVISIGHTHPHYVKTLSEQLGKMAFYSNAVECSLRDKVADTIGKISGYEDFSLFLCNSGAEANENALKLASFHTGKSKILAFQKAFHGRTSGAVAATDNPKIQSAFNAAERVVFVALNDIAAVEKELASGEYAAVIIEGIQGVSGIHTPSMEFMHCLRKLSTQYGVVLILDEIQSGCGRTGRYFAHQWAGITPDIITIAKGTGNGFPIGGVLISPLFEARKGMLGTTFGGNQLACAAAIAVAEVMQEENLIENAAHVGEYIIEKLQHINGIKDVRGKGLMIGFDIEGSASELRKRLLFEKHIFTGGAGEHTVRLLPPLTIGTAEADIFLNALQEVI